MTTTAPWHLSLLGSIELTGPDPVAADRILVQEKHVALLAYLAVEGAMLMRNGRSAPCYQRRDRLSALFWPDLDQAHARASLRRVVHQIREALGAAVLLSRGDEELALDSGQMSSDVEAFVRELSAGRLMAALNHSPGELMPGFYLGGCVEFERWMSDRRTDLMEDAGGAAWALAQRFQQDQHYTDAGRWARRALRYAWNDERILRRALVLLEGIGDRAGALRLYEDFAKRLRTEYDATPSAETVAVANRLRA